METETTVFLSIGVLCILNHKLNIFYHQLTNLPSKMFDWVLNTTPWRIDEIFRRWSNILALTDVLLTQVNHTFDAVCVVAFTINCPWHLLSNI